MQEEVRAGLTRVPVLLPRGGLYVEAQAGMRAGAGYVRGELGARRGPWSLFTYGQGTAAGWDLGAGVRGAWEF